MGKMLQWGHCYGSALYIVKLSYALLMRSLGLIASHYVIVKVIAQHTHLQKRGCGHVGLCLHRGLLVLGMQLPSSFQRHGSPVRRELTGVQAHHQDENDLKIQDMEASLTVMLQEIQPIWWHLKGIKVIIILHACLTCTHQA